MLAQIFGAVIITQSRAFLGFAYHFLQTDGLDRGIYLHVAV